MSTPPTGLRRPIMHVIGDAVHYRLGLSTALAPLLLQINALEYQIRGRRGWTVAHYNAAFGHIERLHAEHLGLGGETERRRAHTDALSVFEAESCDRETIRDVVADLAREGLLEFHGDKVALAKPGLREAVDARPYATLGSVTAHYLAATLTVPVRDRMARYLEKRLPRSRDFNEIDELVNNYVFVVCRRDGLRPYIAEGRYPSPSQLNAWAYRAALSHIRDEGRDALTRGFKGARTERDLADPDGEAADLASVTEASEHRALYMSDAGEDGPGQLTSGVPMSLALMDVVGGNLDDEIQHRMSRERGEASVDRAVARMRKGGAERCLRVLSHLRADLGSAEIANREKVGRNRATTLMAEVRESIRDHVLDELAARRVLRLVEAEPCSTLIDVREYVSEMSESDGEPAIAVEAVANLVMRLVSNGRLQVGRGGSLLVTEVGRSALEAEPRTFAALG